MRSFFGYVEFYRHLIKDFNKISRPICNLLAKDILFVFDVSCLEALEKLKQLLTSSTIVQARNSNLPFKLMCNAFDYIIGAILRQRVDRILISFTTLVWHWVMYYWITQPWNINASSSVCIKKIRSYLMKCKIIIFTDHIALKYLLIKKDAKAD